MRIHFRIGRTTYALVPRTSVIRPESRERARQLLAPYLEDELGRLRLRDWLDREDKLASGATLDDAVDLAIERLARNELVLIQDDAPARLLSEQSAVALADLRRHPGFDTDPLRPASDEPARDVEVEPGWIAIQCVTQDGRGYPGAQCSVSLPDGRSHYAQLDGTSTIRLDGIPAGTCGFSVTTDAEIGPIAGPPIDESRRGPVAPGDRIDLATGRAHVLVLHFRARLIVQDRAGTAALGRVNLGNYAPQAALRQGQVTMPTTGNADVFRVEGLAFDDRLRVGPTPAYVHKTEIDDPFGGTFEVPVQGHPIHLVIVRRPYMGRLRTNALRFASESPLLVPLDAHTSTLRPLATALAWQQRTNARLLIVGHASSDGGASFNEALADRRARGVHAMLTRDRETWVTLAAEHGFPADVQRMLGYVASAYGWKTDPGRLDGVSDPGVTQAVTEFQRQFSERSGRAILIDGIVGVETLGALFDTFCRELEIHLEQLGLSPDTRPDSSTLAVGVSDRLTQHARIPESFDPGGQRRVDLLIVDEANGWDDSMGADALIDRARIYMIELDPATSQPGELVIRLVDHYDRPLVNARYTLETTAEIREGTTDEDGFVREPSLEGENIRLSVEGGAVILFDEAQRKTNAARNAPGPAPVDEDEPMDPDEPLPSATDPAHEDLDDDDG